MRLIARDKTLIGKYNQHISVLGSHSQSQLFLYLLCCYFQVLALDCTATSVDLQWRILTRSNINNALQ